MVYVINVNGQPLMPTSRCGKVRRLLKENKAKVVKRCPFTIQLLYETTDFVDKINLKVDTGSKTVGFSAVSKIKEYISAKLFLREDITNLLSTKRENRRTRRNRKRYRAPRFKNRRASKKEGWLPPSILHKIETHFNTIKLICSILPINKIILEVGEFDPHLLKAMMEGKELNGTDYQEGEQKGFWNTRAYVLHRDGHKCQCCKGKSKDSILEVHHIESRKTGGNAPNNLVTLCSTCHKGYHSGTVKLPSFIKRMDSLRDSTFMNILKWQLYNRLVDSFGKEKVSFTYGYLTKNNRIENKLPKDHHIDAFCIEDKEFDIKDIKRADKVYIFKKVRCHNRQIHKANFLKGGKLKLNQAPYLVKDFRLFDKVLYDGKECFIFGRRSTGSFLLKTIDGVKIKDGVNYKKLKLVQKSRHLLVQSFSNV